MDRVKRDAAKNTTLVISLDPTYFAIAETHPTAQDRIAMQRSLAETKCELKLSEVFEQVEFMPIEPDDFS